MSIITLRRNISDNGLRPLKPSKDLLGVAQLIEEAFADELDRSGRAALREMRWMGRWGLLLIWLDYLSPDVNTYLNGFVWTDNGRIVGNTTVSRNSSDSKNWFISNVAVAEKHRRRGIARQMMEAALEFVQEMHGRSVSLQVRRGNDPAVHLYNSLGFKFISATTYLKMMHLGPVQQYPLPAGVVMRLHRLNLDDAHAAYTLARASTPSDLQRERPLRFSRFRLGQEVTFNNLWRTWGGIGQTRHWVVEESPGKFAGILNVVPGGWNREHKMWFMVHPTWRGKLERPLVSVALSYLKTCPQRPILLQHPDEHAVGIEALVEAGFKIRRTHMWLKLVF